MNDLNAENMKKILWDTLQKLQSDQIDPAKADEIATQCREILRVIRIQLNIAAQADIRTPPTLIDYATARTVPSKRLQQAEAHDKDEDTSTMHSALPRADEGGGSKA